MTALEQACDDLTAWLPRAAALLTQPDTQPTAIRAKPRSKPPWNSAAATALYDALEGIRRTHADMLSAVTSTYIRPSRAHSATGRTLASIQRLAHALPPETVDEITCQLNHHITVILRLPAVDLEEQILKPDVPCPRCSRKMLRYRLLKGELACLGCQRKAVFTIGLSGPMVVWDDGEITTAPEGTP